MALIQCPECGKSVSEHAVDCPHCGYPLKEARELKEQSAATEQNTVQAATSINAKPRKSSNTGLIVLPIIVVAVIVVGIIIYSNSGSSQYAYTTDDAEALQTLEVEIPVEQQLSNVKTIGEAKKLLPGTTWHYTENTSVSKIGFWVKVEFLDSICISYYAEPQDGKWTKSKETTYTIEEGRFSNTGEKYIAVRWEAGGYKGLPCKYAIVLNNHQFAVTSALPPLGGYSYSRPEPDYGEMEFGDYSWD